MTTIVIPTTSAESVGSRTSYLAKGDTTSPTSSGVDEQLVGSTQIMTASRFTSILEAEAELRRFAASAPFDGGFADIGARGRFFETAKVEAGSLAGTITVKIATSGYDQDETQLVGFCPARGAVASVIAQGPSWFLIRTDLASYFEDLPYEDDGATTYNVGVAVSTIPTKAEQNPRTGFYEYTQETAVVGVLSSAVVAAYDSIANELTLTIGNSTLLGEGSSLAGRTAVVYHLAAHGDTATAFAFGTLAFGGVLNSVTISGALGQDLSDVDLDEANYRVCVLGPVVWAGAKDTDTNGVAWVGHGRNGAGWDTDGQTVFPTTFGMLSNFLRMSDPSDAGADLVSLPKVSIRPNDNEPGTARQIEVWSDAAATSLAFAIDKDGNMVFSGDLTSATPPFSIGVDDDVTDRVTALEVFHTTEAIGPGNPLKGPRIVLSAETATNLREPFASVSGVIRDVTDAAVDGELLLGAYKGSVENLAVYVSEHGETFVGSNVRTSIGPSAGAGHYDPHTDGAINGALIGVGDTDNAIASWNTTPSDSNGGRKARVGFLGTRSDGAPVAQALILAGHVGTATDDLSALSFSVNDGSGYAEAATMTYEDDASVIAGATRLNVNRVRGLSGGPVAVERASNSDAGAKVLLSVLDVWDGDYASMVAAGLESRISWELDSSQPFNGYTGHIGVAPVATGYEMRFSGFGVGAERLLMNAHFDGTPADDRLEIYSLNSGSPDPFETENLSPLQVLHAEASAYSGIDIGSRVAGDADGDRTSGINFLGLRSTLTECRLAGIRAHLDADLGSGNYSGKATLFVNGGGGTALVSKGIEVYSTGYVRSPGTATWASVTFGAPPTYADQCGFDTGTVITNPAVGTYVLTFATTMTGASLNSVVFVQPNIGGGGGRGVWTSTTTLTCYLWTSAAVPVDADFHVICFGNMDVKVAP